jgi:type I restriction enzyme S subunit
LGKTERCIDDEIPFEIPNSWEWVRLYNLVTKDIKRGKSPKYIDTSNTLVFAQKCNSKLGIIKLELAKYLDETTSNKYSIEDYLQDKDIVINSTGTGTLGRIGLYRNTDNPRKLSIVPDSHVTTIRLHKFVDYNYILYVLKSLQETLEKAGEGSTNQKELRPDTIKNLLIPIPPINEQYRIVEQIEKSIYYITEFHM